MKMKRSTDPHEDEEEHRPLMKRSTDPHEDEEEHRSLPVVFSEEHSALDLDQRTSGLQPADWGAGAMNEPIGGSVALLANRSAVGNLLNMFSSLLLPVVGSAQTDGTLLHPNSSSTAPPASGLEGFCNCNT
ncbi:hypothetical protein EYF80_034248 [Liparis tanakae]|uniref:Uncharacterized protein n=1 Tax=Liparis tanakae TaxID=230148 RepID=A0A4Z2GPY1_9TELE|nr:hypothetical protein EYF80_034248 [Liparis tanakae]